MIQFYRVKMKGFRKSNLPACAVAARLVWARATHDATSAVAPPGPRDPCAREGRTSNLVRPRNSAGLRRSPAEHVMIWAPVTSLLRPSPTFLFDIKSSVDCGLPNSPAAARAKMIVTMFGESESCAPNPPISATPSLERPYRLYQLY